jgi:transketolase
LVDLNDLQGFGTTHEVADLGPLADKFRGFGLPTVVVDGHDAATVVASLLGRPSMTVPRVVVAKTYSCL